MGKGTVKTRDARRYWCVKDPLPSVETTWRRSAMPKPFRQFVARLDAVSRDLKDAKFDEAEAELAAARAALAKDNRLLLEQAVVRTQLEPDGETTQEFVDRALATLGSMGEPTPNVKHVRHEMEYREARWLRTIGVL